MWKFTTINHIARRGFKLSMLEYSIIDIIAQLSANPSASIQGWCNASNKTIADWLDTTDKTVIETVKKAVALGLIDKQSNGNGQIPLRRATSKWYDAVNGEYIPHTQKVSGTEKKLEEPTNETSVPHTQKVSTPHTKSKIDIYIDNDLEERESRTPDHVHTRTREEEQPLPEKLAPEDATDFRYKTGMPCNFTAAQAEEKLTLYLSNPNNRHSVCASTMLSEAKNFTPKEWGDWVQKFVAWFWAAANYQSAYSKDFPAVLRSFQYFLKRNKGALGSPRPVFPALEEVLAAAESVRNGQNSQKMKEICEETAVKALHSRLSAPICSLMDRKEFEGVVPLDAQCFIKFIIKCKGVLKIAENVVNSTISAKENTKYLDGLKSLYAMFEAQINYQNKTVK